MTVSELIAHLEKVDPDLPVMLHSTSSSGDGVKSIAVDCDDPQVINPESTRARRLACWITADSAARD